VVVVVVVCKDIWGLCLQDVMVGRHLGGVDPASSHAGTWSYLAWLWWWLVVTVVVVVVVGGAGGDGGAGGAGGLPPAQVRR